jgi:3-oxoacyl-[acyl-carrier protein] reductase
MEMRTGCLDVLVTGASSGVGRELVSLLASQTGRFRIFALSRRFDLLKSLASEYPQGVVVPVCMDITSFDFTVLTDILSKHQVKQIDIVYNNAGMLVNSPFSEISRNEWEQVYKTNVIGPALVVKELMPLLGVHGISHVVNIGSMGGVCGSVKFGGLTAYSSSKGALSILTEVLAEEFKGGSVFFNCLALGSVDTEMLAKAFPGFKASTSAIEMAGFISDFGLNGWRFFNGKVLPVSNSTP